MEIYVVHKQDEFNKRQLERINHLGKVYFIESSRDIEKLFISKKEKIVALDPGIAGFKIDSIFLGKIKELKGLCLFTTTTHYVDLLYCKNNKIIVTNNVNYACDAIAEYLMFMAMCCCRKLPLQLKFGKQEFSDIFTQKQLVGKVAGIIGLGNIGSKLAALCKSMGMRVVYWSKDNRDSMYKYLSMDDIFANADIIFNTLAINNQTIRLITDQMLTSMKKSAIFVSGTSTHLHNHDLVVDNVKRGRLFGYAVEEKDKTLLDYSGNIMVTSEYDWFTREALTARIDIWIDSIELVLSGKAKSLIK